ncbi:MAG: rod shape-determining protein MreD [Armatimonadota bacterium]|nr:rod shape-determining protein MreD [Armatimonadota bacterium]
MKLPAWLQLVLLLVLATALQAAFAYRLRVWGVQPDLNKVVLICIAVNTPAHVAVAYGFVAGWLMGTVVGMSLGSYLVSRMMLGAALGLLELRVFRHNPVVLVFSALTGSLLCEAVFFLFSPQPDVSRWVVQALGESGYNLVFVLPIAWWVRRLLPPVHRLDYT